MVFQFGDGEIPCPLCVPQRVAMLGSGFGIVLHFRHGYSGRSIGRAFSGPCSSRSCRCGRYWIVVCPRPGHDYLGSAVLGLPMPVWSVVIAVALLASFATELALFDDGRLRVPRGRP